MLNDKINFLADMETLQGICETNEKVIKDAQKLFGIDAFDCPMFNNVSDSIDFIISNISRIYDIDFESIKWFVFDNNFGDNAMYASSKNKKKTTINNTTEFWDFEK